MAGRRTKRSDGRFCLNITVENADGTKRRIYFYGRTQAEAKAKAAAVNERVGRGEPVRDASRTVSDWLAEWRTTSCAQATAPSRQRDCMPASRRGTSSR
jgi:hypothetical protein